MMIFASKGDGAIRSSRHPESAYVPFLASLIRKNVRILN
jgi:hypothetical protein